VAPYRPSPPGRYSPVSVACRCRRSVSQQVLSAGSYVVSATIYGDHASFDPFLYVGFDPVVSAGFSFGAASLAQACSGSLVHFPSTDEGPLPVLGVARSLA
jgi:hypothetical protein